MHWSEDKNHPNWKIVEWITLDSKLLSEVWKTCPPEKHGDNLEGYWDELIEIFNSKSRQIE